MTPPDEIRKVPFKFRRVKCFLFPVIVKHNNAVIKEPDTAESVRRCAAAKVNANRGVFDPTGDVIHAEQFRLICEPLINQTFRNCTFAQYVTPIPNRLFVILGLNFPQAFRRNCGVILDGKVFVKVTAFKSVFPVLVNVIRVY